VGLFSFYYFLNFAPPAGESKLTSVGAWRRHESN